MIGNELTKMMRVEDVASFTGLSTSYLNKLRVTGFGPPFMKIGRAVLYKQKDVEDWLEKSRRQSTSDKG